MSERQLKIAGLVIGVSLILLAVAVLFTAYGYSRLSGLFPIFIGWIFLALAVAETAVALTALRRGTSVVGASGSSRGSGIIAELAGPAWLALLLALIGLGGFLVAVPAFMLLYLVVAARRRLLQALSIAAGALGFVYVVFVWALEYRLYPGLIFGG